jgi:hypothetical protein
MISDKENQNTAPVKALCFCINSENSGYRSLKGGIRMKKRKAGRLTGALAAGMRHVSPALSVRIDSSGRIVEAWDGEPEPPQRGVQQTPGG